MAGAKAGNGRVGAPVALSVFLLGLFLAGCGGGASPPESPAASVGSGETAGTSGPTPVDTADAICPGAVARDSDGRFFVSLSDPICFDLSRYPDLSALLMTTFVADYGVGNTPESSMYAVQLESPYGRAGCASDLGYALRITLEEGFDPAPLGGVVFGCGPQAAGAACDAPAETGDRLRLSGLGVAPCLAWDDTYVGELWFRVEITYYRIGTAFAYLVPPDTESFAVPSDAAPRLDESQEICLERKDVTISVVAVFPDGPERGVGARSIVAECER